MTQGKEMNDLMRYCDQLKAANAELLAAFEELVAACTIPDETEPEPMRRARAAIAAARGAA